MSRPSFISLSKSLLLAILMAFVVTSDASTWYASIGGDDANDGQSWENAFRTIQVAIDSASGGDEIIVASGDGDSPAVYDESIDFKGKSIYLRSTDPSDPNVVANTIIDGGGVTNVVYFHTGEDPNAILDGFTVQGGTYGVYVYGSSATPTIDNCVIQGNSNYGVNISNSSPTIEDTIIMDNSSYGVYVYGSGSDPVLLRSRVENNGSYGINFYRSGGTVQNCVISHNSTHGIYFTYYYAQNYLVVDHCTIVGNTTCGLQVSSSTSASQVLTNSIIWGNGDDLINASYLDYSYCCIEDMDEGEGVVHSNPLFVDSDNDDYHLQASSSCIGAADDGSELGAYGNTDEATAISDVNGDGLTDEWQLTYWPGFDAESTDPNAAWLPEMDPDGDGLRNIDEYYLGYDPTVNDSADGVGAITTLVENVRLGVRFASLTEAIESAEHGDELVAATGTYYEAIDFKGKSIHLRSTDPSDPNVVANTIIDGGGVTNVVYFHTGEDPNAILDGFTVQGGTYGVYVYGSSATPTIDNCVIQGNSNYGVNISNSSPTIEDTIIMDNSSYGVYVYGSGSDPVLLRSRVENNGSYGINFYRSGGTVQNCVISHNSTHGIYFTYYYAQNYLVVDHCTIVGNTTCGLQVSSSTSASQVLTNSIIWGNGDDLINASYLDYSYCCIEDMDEGEGVVHSNPLFVDSDNGDYHLQASSSCIGAADDSGELGAYGNTDEATVVGDANGDGLADAWQLTYWPEFDASSTDPNAVWLPEMDPDGDGLRNIDEYYLGYDPMVNDSDDGVSVITTLVENVRLGVRFASLTEAIESAEHGDELVAATGTYYEAIDFKGKSIHLRSTDPSDPNVVANTIIDGGGVTNVVYFHTGEDPNAILDGFTVQGGTYGVYVYGSSATPTIDNCVIQGNSNYGVNISNSSPTIEDTIIMDNSSYGVYVYGSGSDPVLLRSRVENNGSYGINFYRSGGTVQNCVISHNSTHGIYFTYYYAQNYLVVDHCTIVGNTTCGLQVSSSTSASQVLTNSIIWGNGDDLINASYLDYSYCCIEDMDEGEGVVHSNPLFVDSDNGDYHLQASSSCIGAADDSGELGAYGNTDEATVVGDANGDGLADAWQLTYWPEFDASSTDPNAVWLPEMDPDGDGLRNIDEYYLGYDPMVNDSDDGVSVITTLVENVRLGVRFASLTEAIESAEHGDELVAATGTYYEAIDFKGKSIHVRSTDPSDPNVVANTIIDGGGVTNVVYFHTGEDPNAILDGFTVQGGTYGVYVYGSSATPTIDNCVIQGNSNYGVNISNSSPTIEDTIIMDNSSYGVYVYGSGSDPVLLRSRVENNGSYGINFYRSGGTVQNCVISHNSTHGIYFTYYYAQNYLVVDHCTIVGNTTCGLQVSSSTSASQVLTNSIIWGNGDDLINASYLDYSYCCIEDMDEGEGVVHSNPLFVDSDNDDYHLQASSSCIGAADDGSELGAYGNTDEATAISDVNGDGLTDEWQLTYWPGFDAESTDPNAAWLPEMDPDGDGLRNIDEYYLGYDPTVNDSADGVGAITTLVENVRLGVNFPSITEAIESSEDNDLLIAAAATYDEAIDFKGKSIHLRSTDPDDPNVVANTIIDGGGATNVVYFHTSEDPNAILDGFAVQGGTNGIYCYESSSAGICCPTIQNCIIQDNSTNGIYVHSYASPTVEDCVIRNNGSAGIHLYSYNSVETIVRGCDILNNGFCGIWAYDYYPSFSIENCLIARNNTSSSANSYGICFNEAGACSIINCTIVGHTDTSSSYGISVAGSVLSSGLVTIKNSILWDNKDDISVYAGSASKVSLSYCCIEDMDKGCWDSSATPVWYPWSNVIHTNPLFADYAGGDYHLQAGSACLTLADDGGNLGAYGGTLEATVVSDANGDGLSDEWQLTYWPGFDAESTDPNAAWLPEMDPDGDGLRNIDEYYLGYDPTVNDSADGVGAITTLVENVRLGVKFSSIYEAIEFSENNDVLIAAAATYDEAIDFKGKSIHLRSTDPDDPNVVANTIIDGDGATNVIYFHTSEDPNAILDGFTVQGGTNGVYCYESSSAGICSPTIQNCIIQDNSTNGIYVYRYAFPTVEDCLVCNNGSAGIYLCSYNSVETVIRGCEILDNGTYGIYSYDYYPSFSIENCVIATNNTGTGTISYGIYFQEAGQCSIVNCTIVGNTDTSSSYGISVAGSVLSSGLVTIKNSILWDNKDDISVYAGSASKVSLSYCCIEDMDEGCWDSSATPVWYPWSNVIHTNPLFVDYENDDYHLQASSSCIGAADDGSELGAYGNTDEATVISDVNGDGLTDEWQLTYWPDFDAGSTDPNAVWLPEMDPDGDGLRNIDEYYLGYDPTVNDSADGIGAITTLVENVRLGVNFPSLTEAFDSAESGDELIASAATYYESIDFNGKPVHLRSTNPSDPNVVANTIIDGDGASNVVYFHTGEDPNAILDGFTVTGGTYGVYCDTAAFPSIRHCVMQNNSSNGVYIKGSPLLEDCVVKDNDSYGISVSVSGTAYLSRCEIINNAGYGIYSYRASLYASNCLIVNNGNSGILYSCYSTDNRFLDVDHCTVVDHVSSGISASLSAGSQQITNSILWGNNNDLSLSPTIEYSYCCIEDMDEGEGIIHSNPLFVDASGSDYHLGYGSQCLTADNEGDNLGAYGGTSETTVISDPNEDGLSDDWQFQYWASFDPDYTDPNEVWAPDSDPDGDGLRNIDEYYLGYDPTVNDSDDGVSVITTLVENVHLGVYFPSLTEAIDFAENKDELIASAATYYESIDFNGKPVRLRSTNPSDPNVVANTIIDGDGASNVVYFHTGEDPNAILDGFTVTGGTYGVYCDTAAFPSIRHCVMQNNSSNGVYIKGSPLLEDCVVKDNDSYGISVSVSGTAYLSRCEIINNAGYGIYSYRASLYASNCLIVNNGNSGILYSCYSTDNRFLDVDHCTVVDHVSSGISASLSAGSQQITNSILWGNNNDLSLSPTIEYSYCCIEDMDEGEGVIHSNPLFVDAGNDDYHLQASSSCIGAADDGSELGAYGNTDEATSVSDVNGDGLSDAWQLTYWPDFDAGSTDPNAVWLPEMDPDGDGLRNIDEYYLGYDPTVNDSDDGSSVIATLVENVRLGVRFASLSEAINAAEDGDELIASAATYYESIDFNGKPVRLRSTNPSDPNVVANTIIDGDGASNVVYFHTGEDPNAILDGFTVTGGTYGVYCDTAAFPSIRHCVMQNNSSNGVYIKGSPLLEDCVVKDNDSYGISVSVSGTAYLSRCEIMNNAGYGIYSYRASLYASNCLIVNNGNSGILYSCYSTDNRFLDVDHCTIVGHVSSGISASLSAGSQQITNSILWGNNNDLSLSPTIEYSYCCIEDMDEGEGVIHSNPLFVDAGNDDYHLQASSSCIGAADDGSELGAYGNTDEATSVSDVNGDGLSDAWQLTYWASFDPNDTDPNEVWAPDSDPDGDGLRNIDEYYLGYDPTVNDSDDGSSVIATLVENVRLGVYFASLTEAIESAENEDELIASAATYDESIDFKGKSLYVRSTDPSDSNVVANTIVDANGLTDYVVYFHTNEDSNVILDGFTVQGGTSGIYCDGLSSSNVCSPTIRNCIVQNNSSYGIYVDHYAFPAIENCIIRNNGSTGIYLCNYLSVEPLIRGCNILNNGYYGIQAFDNYPSVTVENCVIDSNNTKDSGLSCGIYLREAGVCNIIHCTVTGHTGTSSNGIVILGSISSSGFVTVKNNILWDNRDDISIASSVTDKVSFSYCCIEDMDEGEGVIHSNPMFVDFENGDYHLQYASFCVDSGDPNSVYSNEPEDGGMCVNIGAYGNTAEATVVCDLNEDGLSDDWQMTYWSGFDVNYIDPNTMWAWTSDPDNDGLRNADEYHVGSNPIVNNSKSGSDLVETLVHNERLEIYYPSIIQAIDFSENGDVLIARMAIYDESVDFKGKPVYLKSTDPTDPNVVAATIIGSSESPVVLADQRVLFITGETGDTVLDGFTIRDGAYGIYCNGTSISVPVPVVRNCVVEENQIVSELSGSGAGVYIGNYGQPDIQDCLIKSNEKYGFYIMSIGSTVANCQIQNNNFSGLYLDGANATARNCLINGHNGADYSSGVYVSSYSSILLEECTIVDNDFGGIQSFGVYDVGGKSTVHNCIIWSNGTSLSSSATSVEYSCIEGGFDGIGNIADDPLFIDASGGDYHLKSENGRWDPVNQIWTTDAETSSCLDAGQPWADFSNEPSGENGSRINMGAYGNTQYASKSICGDDGIADQWQARYWDGTDGKPLFDPNDADPNALWAPAGDYDNDGFSNEAEYLYGYDPITVTTDPLCIVYWEQIAPQSDSMEFDPTEGQTIITKFWINKDIGTSASMEFTNDETETAVVPFAGEWSVRENQIIWDGTDTTRAEIVLKEDYISSLVVENGVESVSEQFNTITLTYSHEVTDILCSPSRIIPAFGEYTNIVYQVTVEAPMLIEVYRPDDDPDDHAIMPFAAFMVTAGDTNPPWDGRSNEGYYPSIEGFYNVKVQFEGMRENAKKTLMVAK